MRATDTSETQERSTAQQLADEMKVTFDSEELSAFFDGFSPLDCVELCSALGGEL